MILHYLKRGLKQRYYRLSPLFFQEMYLQLDEYLQTDLEKIFMDEHCEVIGYIIPNTCFYSSIKWKKKNKKECSNRVCPIETWKFSINRVLLCILRRSKPKRDLVEQNGDYYENRIC